MSINLDNQWLNDFSQVEKFYSTVFQKANIAFILFNADKILDCNEYATNLLQYSKDELLNKHLLDISYEKQNNKLSFYEIYKYISQALADNEITFEWIFKKKITL